MWGWIKAEPLTLNFFFFCFLVCFSPNKSDQFVNNPIALWQDLHCDSPAIPTVWTRLYCKLGYLGLTWFSFPFHVTHCVHCCKNKPVNCRHLPWLDVTVTDSTACLSVSLIYFFSSTCIQSVLDHFPNLFNVLGGDNIRSYLLPILTHFILKTTLHPDPVSCITAPCYFVALVMPRLFISCPTCLCAVKWLLQPDGATSMCWARFYGSPCESSRGHLLLFSVLFFLS